MSLCEIVFGSMMGLSLETWFFTASLALLLYGVAHDKTLSLMPLLGFEEIGILIKHEIPFFDLYSGLLGCTFHSSSLAGRSVV